MFSGVTRSDRGTETDGLLAYFRQADVVVLFIKFLSLIFTFFPFWGHGERAHMGGGGSIPA